MKSLGIGILCILLGVAKAAGQDARLNVFLFEKNYAGLGTPSVIGSPSYYAAVAEPDLLAEAQSAIHLPLYRGLTAQELRFGYDTDSTRAWGINAFLTPQIRLRALEVPSAPLRSLSFMPKFTVQALLVTGGSDAQLPGTRHVFGLNLVLGHHSNGGSGCDFVDETRDSMGDCVSSLNPVPPPENREFQVNDGNFSTNYIELGVGYRRGVTDDQFADHWTWFAEAALSFQHHHDWFGFPLPGGPSPEFGALYGLDRIRLDLSGYVHIAAPLALRLGLRTDRFWPDAERYPGARNYTLQSEAFLQLVDGLGATLPFGLDILGLGVRYSRGQDYYNTQFVRDINLWQIILTFDPWSPKLD